MFDPLLLFALSSAVLLGSCLFWVIRAERRRASRDLRVRALVLPIPNTDGLYASLRKPRPQRKALPAALASRIDLVCATTGNRVGLLQLAVSATIAATTMAITAAVAGFGTPLVVALSGAMALAAPALLVQLLQSRFQRQFLDAFPDALDLIVRAVRAGLPAPEAMELAAREIRAPVGAEFQRMLDELRIGVDMAEALQRAAERIRVPDFQFFVVSLLLQRQTGGGIAETLANLSTIIRQRKALRQKARALSAEAQASAAIIATTPFVAGIGLFLINRELMSILFVDPRGRFMLSLAIVGLLSGIAAMKALIKRNVG